MCTILLSRQSTRPSTTGPGDLETIFSRAHGFQHWLQAEGQNPERHHFKRGGFGENNFPLGCKSGKVIICLGFFFSGICQTVFDALRGCLKHPWSALESPITPAQHSRWSLFPLHVSGVRPPLCQGNAGHFPDGCSHPLHDGGGHLEVFAHCFLEHITHGIHFTWFPSQRSCSWESKDLYGLPLGVLYILASAWQFYNREAVCASSGIFVGAT